MIKDKNILQTAKDTILIEAEAIKQLAEWVNEDFEKAVMTIYESEGQGDCNRYW